jgi:hypothetical protein
MTQILTHNPKLNDCRVAAYENRRSQTQENAGQIASNLLGMAIALFPATSAFPNGGDL